jgi:hypothetical protein
MQMSTYAILILFMVLWYNQGALGFLFNLSDSGVTAFGIDPIQVAIGHEITDIRQITGGA